MPDRVYMLWGGVVLLRGEDQPLLRLVPVRHRVDMMPVPPYPPGAPSLMHTVDMMYELHAAGPDEMSEHLARKTRAAFDRAAEVVPGAHSIGSTQRHFEKNDVTSFRLFPSATRTEEDAFYAQVSSTRETVALARLVETWQETRGRTEDAREATRSLIAALAARLCD